MGMYPLPPDNQAFAKLELRLEAGDLTLDDIREIEDTVLVRPADEKTRKIGEAILVRAGEMRRALVDRDIVRLDKESDLGSKVRRLYLKSPSWTESESLQELSAIRREVPLEADVRLREAARKQLENLEFAIDEPLIYEFESSMESTFASRMGMIAEMMLRQNSLTPFKEGLNMTQQREIVRYAAVDA